MQNAKFRDFVRLSYKTIFSCPYKWRYIAWTWVGCYYIISSLAVSHAVQVSAHRVDVIRHKPARGDSVAR